MSNKTKRADEREGEGAREEFAAATDTTPAPPPDASGTKTPPQWLKELKTPRWAHAAASSLHGWREHKYHAGQSLELTRDDYDKAITAANDYRDKATPHAPALSPHKGKGL